MAILYRGISATLSNFQAIIDEIKSTGIPENFQGNRSYRWANPSRVRAISSMLIAEPKLIRSRLDELPATRLLYACGDTEGAYCYASDGKGGVPLIVEFEQEEERLAVDGRDFLHTVFQLWDQSGDTHQGGVRSSLIQIFGERVGYYFDLAASISAGELQSRLGIADLACFDSDVIRAHIENRVLIHGKGNRKFCSAFSSRLPIPAERIREVHLGRISTRTKVEGQISLKELLV